MNDYTLVILVTLVAFIGLAALLLVPVYRFLKREEKAGKKWTEEHRPFGTSEPRNPSPDGTDSDRSTS